MLNELQRIIIGKAIFQETVNHRLIKQENIISILKQYQWKIILKKYQECEWNQIFSHMRSCSANQLYLQYNDNDKIIKQIQNVHYLDLKVLTLTGNNINNVEAISLMTIQNLFYLNLKRNNIRQIKSLAKLAISSSKYQLILEDNPITDISSLIKLRITKNQNKLLKLQTSIFAQPMHQDLSIIVKFGNKSSQILFFQSNSRIYQQNVQKLVEKNIPTLFIKVV